MTGEQYENIRLATPAWAVVVDAGEGPEAHVLGTAAIVHADGICVTARHVLADSKALVAQLTAAGHQASQTILLPTTDVREDAGKHVQKWLSVRPLAIVPLEDADLAVLQLDYTGEMATVEPDYAHALHEGVGIGACGFPLGSEAHEGKAVLSSFLTGSVSAVVPHPTLDLTHIAHYLVQMPVNTGNSGGPVFRTDSGALVGIVSRRWEVKGESTGLAIVEPIHKAQAVINSLVAEGRERGSTGGEMLISADLETHPSVQDVFLPTQIPIAAHRAMAELASEGRGFQQFVFNHPRLYDLNVPRVVVMAIQTNRVSIELVREAELELIFRCDRHGHVVETRATLPDHEASAEGICVQMGLSEGEPFLSVGSREDA